MGAVAAIVDNADAVRACERKLSLAELRAATHELSERYHWPDQGFASARAKYPRAVAAAEGYEAAMAGALEDAGEFYVQLVLWRDTWAWIAERMGWARA